MGWLLLSSVLWLGTPAAENLLEQEDDAETTQVAPRNHRGDDGPGVRSWQVVREFVAAHAGALLGVTNGLLILFAGAGVFSVGFQMAFYAFLRQTSAFPQQASGDFTNVCLTSACITGVTGCVLAVGFFPAATFPLLMAAVMESGLFVTGALSVNHGHRGRVLVSWLLSEIPHAVLVVLAVGAGLIAFGLTGWLMGKSFGLEAFGNDGWVVALVAVTVGAIFGGTVAALGLVLAEGTGALLRAIVYSALRLVGDRVINVDGGG